jgi:hypothetical protein
VIKGDEWAREVSNWLGTFPWKWFATLTFRPGFSAAQRRWRLRLWIRELQAELGNENFQWFGVPENGRTGQDRHYHILVGGLRDWHAGKRLRWMKRWNRLCGDALIAKFNPDAGGINYILKNVGPNDVDSLELHLNAHTRMQATLGAK